MAAMQCALVRSLTALQIPVRNVLLRQAHRRAASTQQPVQFVPTQMDEAHVRRIGEKDEKMRESYDRLPESFPAHSQPATGDLTQESIFRKRLIYRSKQRGWLEVDLLMGTWADANLGSLNGVELLEYERILNAETIDLYNYVTGKEAPPAHLSGTIMTRLKEFAQNAPLGRADPAAYARAKHIFSN